MSLAVLTENHITRTDGEPRALRNGPEYRFCLRMIPEEEGGFSALVVNLPPGIGSCGETEDEAIENAKEAILGVLESYRESAQEIPWYEPDEESATHDSWDLWIAMNG